MRQEAIREFRKTWKPKEPQGERRASRPSLVLKPRVEKVCPRPSLAHPLPPPAAAALCARGDMIAEGPPTGVRRRPVREDEDREALSRVAKERREMSVPSTHRAPPPLSPSTRAMLLKLERNAKMRKTSTRSHASELTDSSVRILASYPVPGPTELDPSRDAFVPVQADWLEVIEEHAPLELVVAEEAVSRERKRTTNPARRALGYALFGSALCGAFGWHIADEELRGRASAWTQTTVSVLAETWERIVDTQLTLAPRTWPATESSASTLLLCEEQAPSVQVPSVMSEALEVPAEMQSVWHEEEQPLMSEAAVDGFTAPMLTPAREELAPASDELTPSVKRHRKRRHRRNRDHAIQHGVLADAAR